MNETGRLLVIFFLSLAIRPSTQAASGKNSHHATDVYKIYVGLFGSNPDAIYLRNKLVLRLARSGRLLIIDDPARADLVLNGTAAMRLVGYYSSNPVSAIGTPRAFRFTM